jgi:ferredoxin-NADP reductase
MNFIDHFLNRITMYRLMMYYLMALIAIAIIFGAFGILRFSPLSIIVSSLVIVGTCWIINAVCAKLLHIPANVESVYITAFILTLIISPIKLIPFDTAGFSFLILASVFAMASKYILAINRKHVFNPAAIAVAITAFAFGQYASWWVGGNLPLLAFVVAGGLLVVRKIRRFDLVITFALAALASIVLMSPGFDPFVTAEKAILHTSLLFFAFVMITEPLTTPPTRPLRIAYGLFVGAIFSPATHVGSIYATPELVLLLGNVFSFLISPKRKYLLTLTSKEKIADNIYEFAFATDGKKIPFEPGQYMEFTLDGAGADLRGNRRYFTIASSPAESGIRLGIKFYNDAPDGSSTFKKKLFALMPGDRVLGGSLMGDFTLPRDSAAIRKTSAPRKLAFIAGGIGITPFRSMVQALNDRSEPADIMLFYSNRAASEIAYKNIFDAAAETIGLRTKYINTETDGRIDAAYLMRELPDWRERIFYISGTHGMVTDFRKALRDLGIPQSHIKTDFFPGFA